MIIDHEDLRPQYRSTEKPKPPRKKIAPARSRSELDLFDALRHASGESEERCRENPAAVAGQVVLYRQSLIEEMQNCYSKLRALETQATEYRAEIAALRKLAAKPMPAVALIEPAAAAVELPRQSWFSGVAA
jgi:hypothetical protein